jgi:hypothetical protein
MTFIQHAPIPGFVDSDETELIQPSHLAAMGHAISDEGVVYRSAGETLSALKVVWEDEDGAVWPLDAHDAGHIDLYAGLTLTSADAGEAIKVQRAGVLDANGLNLTPGRVWLGDDGALTQTPPSSGISLCLGAATAGSRLTLSPARPIYLE